MPNDDGTPTAEELAAQTPEEKLAALQKEAEELRAENEKLKNKDLNFERLRSTVKRVEEMTEEERKQWSEKELVLMDRIQKAEDAVAAEKTSKIETWKDAALEKFAGDDAETRKKVLYHFDRIKGDPNDKASIESQMREAVILASADKKEPIGISFSSAGNPVEVKREKADFSKTDKGKELLDMMGHVSPKQ